MTIGPMEKRYQNERHQGSTMRYGAIAGAFLLTAGLAIALMTALEPG